MRTPLRRQLVLALAVCCASHRLALASPLDDPHVGGVGFSGPTTGDLAAAFWNPAALSLIEGNTLQLSSGFVASSTTVQRDAIDPASGLPAAGGATRFPSITGDGNISPVRWPPGPGFFAGLAVDVAGRFTLAAVAYAPSSQHIRFGAQDGLEPARYHVVEADLRNFALVPALAFRIGKNFRVGVAPGFLFSSGSLSFDQDTALARGSAGLVAPCGNAPCGVENPAAAARYDLRGSDSPFASSPSFTVGGGIHYQRGALALAAAYASRPLGKPNSGVEVDLTSGTVTRPALDAGMPAICDNSRPCIDGAISYRLPDTFTLGASYQFNPRWSASVTGRYLDFSQHEELTIRISGPAGSALGGNVIPDRIRLYRGFQDQVELRTRVARQLTPGVRLGAGLRVATAAVPASHVSPAAMDGLTVEPALMAQVRFGWLTLSTGYALALVVPVDVESSVFDPSAATGCVDAKFDLRSPACEVDRKGAGRPSAAGHYSQITHAFSLTASARF